jgi:type I restriction enzyme S subunit
MTATSIISKKDFSELNFRVPQLDEQQAIATILSDIDSEIDALREKLDKARQIKYGMMQELLTGRIRLV